MTKRALERMPIAIGLGLFVCLAQLSGLMVIGLSARTYFYSPAMQCPMEPVIFRAQLFRGELVIPLVRTPNEDITVLRFVDLRTGQSRFSKPTDVFFGRGIVSDGERLFGIGDDDQIYETDGITVVTYRTKHKLGIKPGQLRGAFLYEGYPALIDRDEGDTARLLVLIDREWEDRGPMALPGRGRVWKLDEQSGKEVMIPRTSAVLQGAGPNWGLIHVTAAHGRFYLFQTEISPNGTSSQSVYRISHRIGFDFLADPDRGEPASALAPANAPADTTGWELLPPFVGQWPIDWVVCGDELLCVSHKKLCRLVKTDGNSTPAKIETLMDFNISDKLAMVASPDTNDIYVLVQPRLGEIGVYRLDGNHLVKMPYSIDGTVTPIVRKAGTFFLQILAVLWTGDLLLVLGAAWLTNRTGQSSFSSGMETVPLAPLARRSLARFLDLVLIFMPLTIQMIQSVSRTNSDSIFQILLMNNYLFRDANELHPFVPVMLWTVLSWSAIVASTGIWGVSPGKWLCRIRVLRSTLRSCGFTRAMLRELLLFADAPLMLIVHPAVFSLLSTQSRQRIGDSFADTIVIDVGTASAQIHDCAAQSKEIASPATVGPTPIDSMT